MKTWNRVNFNNCDNLLKPLSRVTTNSIHAGAYFLSNSLHSTDRKYMCPQILHVEHEFIAKYHFSSKPYSILILTCWNFKFVHVHLAARYRKNLKFCLPRLLTDHMQSQG